MSHLGTRRAILRVVLVAAALVPLPSACDSPLAIACTTKGGCADGLMVRLEALPAGSFSVAISSSPIDEIPGPYPIYRYTCTSGPAPCLKDIWFNGYLSSTVYVELVTMSGTAVYERSGVRYPREYPNGKGCSGSCRIGEVRIPLTD